MSGGSGSGLEMETRCIEPDLRMTIGFGGPFFVFEDFLEAVQ